MQSGTVRPKEEQAALESAFGEITPRVLEAVNKVLADCVLSGFSHFGNKNVVDSLLYILELEHAVNVNELLYNLPKFRSAISEMFGSGGVYVLEEKICEELARKLGIEKGRKDLEALVLLLIEETIQRME